MLCFLQCFMNVDWKRTQTIQDSITFGDNSTILKTSLNVLIFLILGDLNTFQGSQHCFECKWRSNKSQHQIWGTPQPFENVFIFQKVEVPPKCDAGLYFTSMCTHNTVVSLKKYLDLPKSRKQAFFQKKLRCPTNVILAFISPPCALKTLL